MTTQTIKFEDYQDAETHVARHAPTACELTLITRHCDAELHTVWLDKAAATVWHAWTEPDLDADGWTLTAEPASVAQSWIEDQIALVLDRLADPEGDGYHDAGPGTDVEEDLAVLAEYEDVQLAALMAVSDNNDPVVVDRIIRGNIARLSAEIARLSRLRGVNLTAAYGTQHGAAASAARALDISHTSASRAMAAPEGYAERARAGFVKARELAG
ncbi:hypothetical protein [Streptomyces sp. NRRL F-5123]|uniref:hypothetical protein n=1 Tax=Streptomyces sp. NRRL F-5123 TaxID=1463856 RepID=UPI0004E0DC82|nr:hypothetical protein [Streptomyces sp. NRRL F-5123]